MKSIRAPQQGRRSQEAEREVVTADSENEATKLRITLFLNNMDSIMVGLFGQFGNIRPCWHMELGDSVNDAYVINTTPGSTNDWRGLKIKFF